MDKAPEAFRTISEVAEALQTPAHVLRFWESKFTQVRPVKRAGGRRYYRPADMDLLFGIRSLLHDQGMTIRGVQKMLQEHGAGHVAGIGRDAQYNDAIEGSARDLSATPVTDADPDADGQTTAPAEATTQGGSREPSIDSTADGGAASDNIIDMRPSGGVSRHGKRGDARASADAGSNRAQPSDEPDGSKSVPDAPRADAPAPPQATPPRSDIPADDIPLSDGSAHEVAIRLRQIKHEDIAPLRPKLAAVADRLDRHLELLSRRSGAGRS